MTDDPTAIEHNKFLIGLLGGGEPELPVAEDAADEPDPEFDGGVRESAPDPESPEQAHNRFVAEFARMQATGLGDL